MTLRININPQVLRWAAQRTGLSPADLSKKAHLHHLQAWLSGEKEPTMRQAEALAAAARIPFGYLLLDEPTEDTVNLPDFRTLNSRQISRISPDLRDVINESSRRLSWYTEYAAEVGIDAPRLLGSAKLSESPEQAAEIAATNLEWSAGTRKSGREAVAILAESIEDAGVLVMRNSIVGNNAHRPLSIEEFRGFTLVEDGFPLIFVNTSDAKTAQLFSLAHELGHVALGKPGISGDEEDGHQVERWCNLFAAELLLPRAQIIDRFSDREDLSLFIEEQSRAYGASREAVIWRLVDLGKIGRTEAEKLVSSLPAIRDIRRGGGGDFRYTTRTRLGRRFLGAVTEAAVSGDLPQRDAARFLGVRKSKAFRNLVDFTLEAA